MSLYSAENLHSLESGYIPAQLQEPGDLSRRYSRQIILSASRLITEMDSSGAYGLRIGSISFGRHKEGSFGTSYRVSAGNSTLDVNSLDKNGETHIHEIRFRKKGNPHDVFVSFPDLHSGNFQATFGLWDNKRQQSVTLSPEILRQKARELSRFSYRITTAIEEGSDPYEDEVTNPDRRLLLKATCALAVTDLLALFCSPPPPSFPSPGATIDKPIKPEITREQLLFEIEGYRNSLGLDGLPPELVWRLSQKDISWEEAEAHPFQNNFPESMLSYGMWTQELAQAILGQRMQYLVWGTKIDMKYSPVASYFDPEDRTVGLPIDIYKAFTLNASTELICHESIGHPTDPGLTETPSISKMTYPLNVLIAVEHGKWKAVSRIPFLPKDAMNYPEDVMMVLRREIGEKTALTVHQKDQNALTTMYDNESLVVVNQKVNKMSVDENISADRLIWTKRRCREFGETLLTLRQENRIRFMGEVAMLYDNYMGGLYAKEGYADLVAYSLTSPERINHDLEVRQGVTEVLSAIRGEPVDLDNLRQQLSTPSQEALNRYEKEIPLRLVDTLDPIEATVNIQDRWYEDFVNGQVRTDLAYTEEQQSLLDRYAQLNQLIIQKYPQLKGTDASGYNVDFDPEWMHIWETRKIEFAVSKPMLIEILSTPEKVTYHLDWIKNAVRDLEVFTVSPQFQALPTSP